MSKVVSIRLSDEEFTALLRAARQMGRSPSDTGAVLLGEALRQRVSARDSDVVEAEAVRVVELPAD